jgi:hypothetical protein
MLDTILYEVQKKVTKQRIIICVVCDSVVGYICIMQIYDVKCGPLADTVRFLLQPFEGKGHHLQQDNYYNSVQLTEALLDKNIRVCGTVHLNCVLSKDLTEEPREQTQGRSLFLRS